MPYRRILLAVDNSTCSVDATRQAGFLARTFDATVVAAHVYAARLHDRRFADLEPSLPSRYQDPKRLEASRRTHESLIGKGLQLISDSYLAASRAALDGVRYEGKSIEGKHYVELARESANGYDLAVIGARGLGLASLDGQCPPWALGGVCERFLRRAQTDVLVTRDDRTIGGTILVGVDGSPESYAALRKALKLAKVVGGRVEVATCFDPNFHPVAFDSIAGVLSEKDAKVFRFKEQEDLHARIIDKGLENLYRGYLDNSGVVAQGRGQKIDTHLLTGKPAYEIASRARDVDPTLLVVSRFGMHRTDDSEIGNTAETLVRLVPCNVLVVNERADEEPIAWSEEADERLQAIPAFMKPMVRKAIESYARSRGLTRITDEVVTAAKSSHGVPLPGHDKGDLPARCGPPPRKER
ncbi:MAG: universal stress protein [Acidobacteriota bacterium]